MNLFQESNLLIRQRSELAELFGYETRNKYEILSAEGQRSLGFAVEQQKGLGGFFMRQFFGHWRSFEIHVFDPARQLLFIARHPFRWIFQCMEVVDPGSERVLGRIAPTH